MQNAVCVNGLGGAWLQSSTIVQQSNSFWVEAVPQSGGPALDAPQPSS